SEYAFIIGHAVKVIDAVYVANIRQTGNHTAYTGQSGNEHASYPGKACIKFTDWAVIMRLWNDISIFGTRECHLESVVPSFENLPYEYTADDASGSDQPMFSGQGGYHFVPSFDKTKSTEGFSVTVVFSVTINDPGTNGFFRVQCSNPYEGGSVTAQTLFEIDSGVVTTEKLSPWVYHTTRDEPYATFQWKIEHGYDPLAFDGDVDFIIQSISITFHGYPASMTGGIAFSGNSVAETVLGGSVACDVSGFADDASGTITGTPNALIERPDHICKHILLDRCGLPSAVINTPAYTAAGADYASHSYVLALAVLQAPDVRQLLNRIAHQAKSLEFWEAGAHALRYFEQPGGENVDFTVYAHMIDLNQIWIQFSKRGDILNDLTAQYLRYWSGYSDPKEATSEVVAASDAESITKYGRLAGDQRSFPYIPGEAQASDVLDWELSTRSDVHLIIEFPGGYFLTAAEKGDVINFSFDADAYLDQALLGLVAATDTFKIIDVRRRNDAAVQIQIIRIHQAVVFADTDDVAWADDDVEWKDY
ncbi:MAG: hypothetical protein U9M89_01855, partial [Patescibacteria group bacterium]|nr:hypothetical protein [Patescibacteria group bacterium]